MKEHKTSVKMITHFLGRCSENINKQTKQKTLFRNVVTLLGFIRFGITLATPSATSKEKTKLKIRKPENN